MIGKSLVHYEISTQLGRGGMGEVYQAKDTKLGRDVAIKVLPEEFALDTDRAKRFQREAKLLASLNHPNIAAIHGLEESNGTHFLVMELIEGDTLADRIKSGPIPLEEALKLAQQIAEALEAAHEKGVIHRDLKPANIKVTPDGKVKVLDFGLAKAYAGDQENMSPLDSPTISAAATQQGVILGTAAYMSPEQARGEAVDKKADIWAFGVVLFEMLKGRQVFTGKTVSDTLASVLKIEPEWQSLPQNLHPRIRFLLERCLEKDPQNRYSNISDVKVDIKKVLADPGGILIPQTADMVSQLRLKSILSWVLAAVILTAIITGIVVWQLQQSGPLQVARLEYELPEDQTFTNIGLPLITMSADGMKIVYAANRQLYLRNLSELTATPIQGSDDNPDTPFFSPDGQWIGYFTNIGGYLKRIAISGGAPVPICGAPSMPQGASWGMDNMILFGQPEGIMRVSADGGTAELLVEAKEGEEIFGPQALPNKKWVLFSTKPAEVEQWDDAQVVVASLETGERRIIIPGGSDARYVPTGHLVYARGGVLFANPFDPGRLEVTGGAVPVIEGVQRALSQTTGTANYGFSTGGILAYVVGSADISLPPRTVMWVDREGLEKPLSAEPDTFQFPKLSPDGSKVALVIPDGNNQDIWIWDVVRETMTRLTFFEGQDIQPVWTPDGNRVVFFSVREGGGVYWKNADGTGEAEFLGSLQDRLLFPWCFSKDGSALITCELMGDRMDIGMLSMEGDHEHKPLLTEEYVEMQAKISPDGRWMAYTANESDDWGVYVRPFPDVNKGKWQVSTGIGIGPLWSPDGKELFYRSPDGIMIVPVDTEPTFKLGKPKVLFPDTYISLAGGESEGHAWDIHPDGDRFLMMKEPGFEERGLRKINVVMNWFEELKRRVPVD